MAVRSCFFTQLFAFLAVVLALTGCAGAPKPIEVEGNISAAAELNPDYNGRSSPVVIRVYQLRSASAFQTADFFTIYDEESAALGKDLIFREELELQPGESREYKREMDPETRFVGVLAAFRDVEASTWRSMAEIPEKKFYEFFKDNKLFIKLGSDSVTVSFGKP